MRTTFRFLIITAIAAAIAGCSTVSYDTLYEPGADFSKYQTYSSRPNPEIPEVIRNSFAAQRIRKAVEEVLIDRGMYKVESGGDLQIVAHAAITEQITSATVNSYGYGYGRYGAMGTGTVTYNTYTEGTLALDFIDTAKNELVWRGIAQGALDPNNLDPSQEKVDKVVSKLLADFPPGHAATMAK